MTSGLDDRYAAGYDDGMQEYLTLHTVERCASFFTPHLKPGMSLLDAGCGPGSITVGLARLIAPGRLVAVDVSEEELQKTRRTLTEAGFSSAQVQPADVRDLPFETGSFDAVFSHAVIDYLPDPERAVEEYLRVLKPGGVIGLRGWAADAAVIGPRNELIEESMALVDRAVGEYGGAAKGLGPMLGKLLKDAGFEQIFIRPSFERIESRDDWESFCRAFGVSYSGGRLLELAVEKGWTEESRLRAIAEAWERFGSDTSNCLGYVFVEALGFKPV